MDSCNLRWHTCAYIHHDSKGCTNIATISLSWSLSFRQHTRRCHRPRRRASLDQSAVHGLHRGRRRHILLVLLRVIEIHVPLRDDHDRRVYLRLQCLCLLYEELWSWSGKRSWQRAGELYRKHFALYGLLARDWLVPWTGGVASVVPEAKPSCHAACSTRLGTLHSFGITVTNLRLVGPATSQRLCTSRCTLVR